MSKKKGSRAERELFHMLWEKNWAVVRSAGSGSTQKPAPDLITSNKERTLAIECKAIKAKYKYFPKEEIDQLKIFAETFGAEPWFALRFDKEGWFFVHLNEIQKSKGESYLISLEFAKKNGLAFSDIVNQE